MKQYLSIGYVCSLLATVALVSTLTTGCSSGDIESQPETPEGEITEVSVEESGETKAEPAKVEIEPVGRTAPVIDADFFQQGDHISIVGNTLAERMQHDGYLEAMLQAQYPELELSLRNMGFSADEVAANYWFRSDQFGTPDEWLTRCDTDVIFAFYGFNESFAGEEGLEAFRQKFSDYIEHTLAQQYNGESNVRLVLFSPIAWEDHDTHNLPSAAERDPQLAAYTQAMAEVAAEHEVPFVDLYTATRAVYPESEELLTLNGVHLNEEGNQVVAELAQAELFGPEVETPNWEELAKLREAIQDKNFHWFHRYRTTDGYNVYGGRAYVVYEQSDGGDPIRNLEVCGREMEVLDVMTANRQQRVWAIAQGGDMEVDDSNAPPFIPVATNLPGDNPDGTFSFMSPEESMEHMVLGEGLEVNLFASEEMFPELINPVQMSFDSQGRLWVATWECYPHWKPDEVLDDRLLIFEDTDGDGQADECKTFAGGLYNPTGFEFVQGGVLVANAPDLLYLKDTDGDDVADVRIRVLDGLGSADSHHAVNSFVFAPDGALYMQEGIFHRSQIETPYGPERCIDASGWRFNPRTWEVDRYVPYGFANPHGHVFDYWGEDIITDGTGAQTWHAPLFSGHLDFPHKHPAPPQLYPQPTRPCPGTEILSSDHFPEDMQGDLLVGNVIGIQGILRFKVDPDGASLHGERTEDILYSTEPNFRPSDLEIGSDGALYFTDWHNPIIGHLQHHLRDPNRDRKHGRIYRITYTGRDLSPSPAIEGEPIPTLLDLLKEPENRVRYRARIELSEHEPAEVLAAVDAWVAGLDESDPAHEHHLLEGLWLYQSNNEINEELLERVLTSPEYQARAAATRVVRYARHLMGEEKTLGYLAQSAQDEHPRVRMHALLGLSEFPTKQAAVIALTTRDYPSDQYLEYVFNETMRAYADLWPQWRAEIIGGEDMGVGSPAAFAWIYGQFSNRELILALRNVDKLQPTQRAALCQLLLTRPGVLAFSRRQALQALAESADSTALAQLLSVVSQLDTGEQRNAAEVLEQYAPIVASWSAEELAGEQSALATLAGEGNYAVTRRLGYLALLRAANPADAAAASAVVDQMWELTASSSAARLDLIQAVPELVNMGSSLSDDAKAGLEAALYEKIAPLIPRDPDASEEVLGRTVRISVPGEGRILSLAEVEVMSDGVNVARGGEATQKTTAYDGVAARAIDGETNGFYAALSITHTNENDDDPWWQVDLGQEYPLDAVAIYNRTEGGGIFTGRLNGFTLEVLNEEGEVVFQKTDQPAPAQSVTIELDENPYLHLRQAAVVSLPALPSRAADAFPILATLIQERDMPVVAIEAISQLPQEAWPAEGLEPLAESILEFLAAMPAEERISPAALAASQLVDRLSTGLPAEASAALQSRLTEVAVQVKPIRVVPHELIYDRAVIVVEAGKDVAVLFDNTDLQPHNLVIVPGDVASLEKVGMAADAMQEDPNEAIARGFVPELPEVLYATPLLQSGESAQLVFTAPDEPGELRFLCTFPGHWKVMHGKVIVVDDVTAWRLENPGEETVIEVGDPPQFQQEYTVEYLEPLLDAVGQGSDYNVGEALFSSASCVKCHQAGDVGGEIGPDLAESEIVGDKPLLELLRAVVEPSHEINEEYQTYTVYTLDGKIFTGVMIAEDDESVTLQSNPLEGCEPEIVLRDDIDEMAPSTLSLMPTGLLNTLTEEEIVELLSYLRHAAETHEISTEE